MIRKAMGAGQIFPLPRPNLLPVPQLPIKIVVVIGVGEIVLQPVLGVPRLSGDVGDANFLPSISKQLREIVLMEAATDYERVPVVQVADRPLRHELLPHSVPSSQLFFAVSAAIVGVTTRYASLSSLGFRHVDIHVVTSVLLRQVDREGVRTLVYLLADQSRMGLDDDPFDSLDEVV